MQKNLYLQILMELEDNVSICCGLESKGSSVKTYTRKRDNRADRKRFVEEVIGIAKELLCLKTCICLLLALL